MSPRITRHIATLAQGFDQLWKSGALVLYYHGVAECVFDPVVQALHMPLDQFEKQIQYLRKKYTILSMEEFSSNLRKRQLRSSHLLLTFDDGYKNNLTVAAPLLKSLNLPFTVFISTKHVDTGCRFPGYYMRASIWCTEKRELSLPSLQLKLDVSTVEQRKAAMAVVSQKMRDMPDVLLQKLLAELRSHIPETRWTELDEIFSTAEPLSWDEVRTLHNQGVTIGSHCNSHSILHPYQEADTVREQVETSKNLIVQHVGECRYFSYPHGTTRDIAKVAYNCVQASYELGFSTVSAPVYDFANPHLVPRVGTPPSLDLLKHAIASCHLNGRRYRRWTQALADPTVDFGKEFCTSF